MKTKQKAESVKTKQKAESSPVKQQEDFTGQGKQKSEGTRLVFSPILFLLSAFLLSAFPGRADDVSFPIQLLTGTAATNRSVVVTPVALYPVAGQVAAYDRVKFVTGTNGSFTVSNMTAGLYQAEVKAPPDRTVFSFVVATNGTGGALVNVSTILVAATNATCPAQSVAYSMSASDVRYTGIGSVRGGIATFLANAIRVSVTVTNTTWPNVFTGTYAVVITERNTRVGNNVFRATELLPQSFNVYCDPIGWDRDFSWIVIQTGQ